MSENFQKFTGTDQYLTSPSLEAAVNCSLALSRPLLVRGEPGTGKTLLAKAVSAALGFPLIGWHIKSTSTAQEGLYTYDTVQRLYDSRFGDGDVRDIRQYIKMGPMGRAFQWVKYLSNISIPPQELKLLGPWLMGSICYGTLGCWRLFSNAKCM